MAAEMRVRVAVVGTLALIAAAGHSTAQGSSTLISPFVALGGPHDIALGDVTGDDVVDVVVSRVDGEVFVRAGQGNGELLAPVPVLSLSGYTILSAVDLDGDGVDDIVVAERDPATVHLVVSGGGGTFTVSDAVSLPSEPSVLLTTDLDEDGDADLAVLCPSGGQLVLLFNTGDAHVEASSVVDVGAGTKHMAAGDVTGDGHVDLVVSDLTGNTITVHRGDGTGAFPQSYDLAVQLPATVVLGDFNADGSLDIVAPAFFLGTLQVLWNRGDGEFLPPVVVGSSGVEAPIVADLNEDGLPDLLGPSATGVTVLLAGSPGPFSPPRHFGIGASAGLGRAATADMNSDGDLDVVAAGQGSSTAPLTVLLGSGDGSLRPVSARVAGDVAFCDLDGDGWLDIVGAYEPLSSTLAVLPGLGFGAFGPPVLTPSLHGARVFELADFDEDGRADCLVAGQGSVSLHLGSGGFTLGPEIPLWFGPTFPVIGTGDLDSDGHEDAVSSCGSLLRVLLGKGDGTFTQLPDLVVQWQPLDLIVAQLDDDQILDVALGFESSPSGIMVLFGRGDGTFEAPAVYAMAPASSLARGDLDNDGDVDLAACTHMTGTVVVLLNAGDGSFSPADDVVLSWPSVRDLELADLDRDGVLDLATVSATGPTSQGMLELHRGLGDGRFSPLDELIVQEKAFDLSAVDVNADGAVDLAVSRGPSLLINRAGPWSTLGGALGGSGGQPKLAATGSLLPGSTFKLYLSEAPPHAVAWLVTGLRPTNLPFKGGVLVPSPDIVIGPSITDSRGRLQMGLTWPAVEPPESICHQFWIHDAAGPFGFCASQALLGEGH